MADHPGSSSSLPSAAASRLKTLSDGIGTSNETVWPFGAAAPCRMAAATSRPRRFDSSLVPRPCGATARIVGSLKKPDFWLVRYLSGYHDSCVREIPH